MPHDVRLAILSQMLLPGWANQSQQAILDSALEQMHGQKASKNVWHEAQTALDLRNMRAVIAAADAPLVGADVRQCKTLADFKRAFVAVLAKQAGTTFKASITITDKAISINGITWKVSRAKAKDKEYPIARVRVDQLLASLTKRTRR